jgi:hypothetical protein
MTFSKVLENAGNREMGLKLDGEDLSPLLKIGLSNENFSLSG